MKLPALILLAALGGIAPALASDWQQQPDSRLRFQGSQQGEAFDGQFRRFVSRIRFDPNDLAQANFDVDIDLASVDTANSERDQAVQGDKWFDVGRFPKAHFRTLGIRSLSAGHFEAKAELTLRDHTQTIDFPFTWTGDADRAHLQAQVVLDRLDFDLGSGEWADPELIGSEVTVSVDLQLRAADTPKRQPPVADQETQRQ